jgi:hypothetical protein
MPCIGAVVEFMACTVWICWQIRQSLVTWTRRIVAQFGIFPTPLVHLALVVSFRIILFIPILAFLDPK